VDKMLWFIYGLLTGLGIVLLGIIGWGFSMFMRVIAMAPIGLAVVAGIVVVLYTFFWILKPSEKKTN